MQRTRGPGETACKIKQFVSWFTHGVPGGARLCQQIFLCRTAARLWKPWTASSSSESLQGHPPKPHPNPQQTPPSPPTPAHTPPSRHHLCRLTSADSASKLPLLPRTGQMSKHS